MDTPDALTSAAAGMRLQADRLDLIAQDLANASTIGYRAHGGPNGFSVSLGSAMDGAPRQGALRRTGVPTDLALVGPGYFAIATADGVRYSRDGRLSMTGDGSLADSRGNKLLGALGPIRFPRGAHLEPNGRVIADGRVIDTLRLVSLPTAAVAGDGPYASADTTGVKAASTTVHPGYLEESTVDPIAEMTALVGAQRAFEADQKAAQRADETLRRAVTDVPAVRQ